MIVPNILASMPCHKALSGTVIEGEKKDKQANRQIGKQAKRKACELQQKGRTW
jgi:hypothetical protein